MTTSPVAAPAALNSAAVLPETEEDPTAQARLAHLVPTPESVRSDLSERLQHINALLSRQAPDVLNFVDEAELVFENSLLVLSEWEKAAFQTNHPGLRVGDESLGSLLRVSVALTAELQEKQEMICQGVRLPALRSQYLNSARYLMLFGQQTAQELKKYSENQEDALSQQLCQQLAETHDKLTSTCRRFSEQVHAVLQ